MRVSAWLGGVVLSGPGTATRRAAPFGAVGVAARVDVVVAVADEPACKTCAARHRVRCGDGGFDWYLSGSAGRRSRPLRVVLSRSARLRLRDLWRSADLRPGLTRPGDASDLGH